MASHVSQADAGVWQKSGCIRSAYGSTEGAPSTPTPRTGHTAGSMVLGHRAGLRLRSR
jgi:hypothetical protein